MQVQKCFELFAPYFFLGFEYVMYNSTQHIFIAMKKSHTNVSWAYTNFISAWIDSNKGNMQASPITTSMSQKILEVGLCCCRNMQVIMHIYH
jgi:hypothetical protein